MGLFSACSSSTTSNLPLPSGIHSFESSKSSFIHEHANAGHPATSTPQLGILNIISNNIIRSHNTSRMLRILTILVAALAVAPGVGGHSWVGQMRNLDNQGNYVGQLGYARGHIAGGAGDPMSYRIVSLDADTLACTAKQQKPEQSEGFPRLKVVPGGFVSMRYNENGHVTLDQQPGKRTPEEGSGTVYIFGTTEPQDDEKLGDVLQWSKDGKGGNGKGILLAAMDYADSRCYEMNGGPRMLERQKANPNWVQGQEETSPNPNSPLMCESNVKIPESAKPGSPYTLYWVWQWPTLLPAPAGIDEYYTTCIDVDVTTKDVAHAAKVDPLPGDTMTKAVDDWASRTAHNDDVAKWNVGPFFNDLTQSPSSGSGNGDSAPSKPDAPAQSPQAPAQSSPTPVKTPSPPADASSSKAATPTPSGPVIPTLTGRPGTAKPSPKPTSSVAPPEDDDDEDMITVTDIVYVTVTAGDAVASSSAADDKRAVTTSATSSPAKVTPSASRSTLVTVKSSQQAPAASAAPSKLPGFNMGGSAKFRGMFT